MKKSEGNPIIVGACVWFAVWQLAIIAASPLPLQEKMLCGVWILLLSGVGAVAARAVN